MNLPVIDTAPEFDVGESRTDCEPGLVLVEQGRVPAL